MGGRLAFASFLLKFFNMPERVQKPFDPAPWGPKQGTKVVRVHPTFHGPTRKIYLKKCGKSTRTSRSATASAPANNGQAAFGARSELFGGE